MTNSPRQGRIVTSLTQLESIKSGSFNFTSVISCGLVSLLIDGWNNGQEKQRVKTRCVGLHPLSEEQM